MEEIPVGGSVEGTIDEAGEYDSFFFRAEEGTVYLIEAVWETMGSIGISIFDGPIEDRSEFPGWKLRESGRPSFRWEWTALQSGAFELKVSSGDDQRIETGSYTVYVSTYTGPPPFPTNLRATLEGDTVRISWEPVEGADYYNLYHNDDSNECRQSTFTVVGCDELATNVTGTDYVHATPDLLIENYYWVTACKIWECSELDGNPSLALKVFFGPPPPTNVRYDIEDEAIRISWDPVEGADYYNLYHNDDGDSCRRVQSGYIARCDELATNVAGTTYVHTDLDPMENYYWVTACNQNACSEIDNEAPVEAPGADSIEPDEPIPSPPTNLRYDIEDAAIRISWDPVDDADYYNVYHYSGGAYCYLRDGEPSFCDELATNVAGTTYVHTDPHPVENHYWVTACNQNGCSEIDTDNPVEAPGADSIEPEAASSATPTGPIPSPPTNLRYDIEDAAIRISWDPVDDAGYYNVYHFFVSAPCELRDGTLFICDELATNVAGTSYVHTDPHPVENHYWVTACNQNGCSEIDTDNPVEAPGAYSTEPQAAPTPSSTPSDTPTETVSTCAQRDKDVLIAFYNATGGEDWRVNRNWLTDEPIGRWIGVATSSRGCVTHLELEDNRLAGEMPAQLGRLSDLKWLKLSHNELSGEIPSELAGLTKLELLFLHFNNLSGEIPEELGNLTTLERLNLAANNLNGTIPPQLGDLPVVTWLNLWNNQLSGEIPEELGNLARLEDLDLGDNLLSGEIPEELGNLARLETLDLTDNLLSGEIPEELGNLARLETLDLTDNLLSGEIPEELVGLSALERLHLGENSYQGCIPAELRYEWGKTGFQKIGDAVEDTVRDWLSLRSRPADASDLEELDLPWCSVLPPSNPALLQAVREDNPDLVESLLAAGLDANTATPHGDPLLYVAIWDESTDIVRILIDADADVNAKTAFGDSLVSLAAWLEHTDILLLLIAAGAEE